MIVYLPLIFCIRVDSPDKHLDTVADDPLGGDACLHKFRTKKERSNNERYRATVESLVIQSIVYDLLSSNILAWQLIPVSGFSL